MNQPPVAASFTSVQYKTPLLILNGIAFVLLIIIVICTCLPIAVHDDLSYLTPMIFSIIAVLVTPMGSISIWRGNYMGMRGYLSLMVFAGGYVVFQVITYFIITKSISRIGDNDFSFFGDDDEKDEESEEERAKRLSEERAEAEKQAFINSCGLAAKVFLGLYVLVALAIIALLSINICSCLKRFGIGRAIQYPNAQLYMPTATTNATAVPGQAAYNPAGGYSQQQQIAAPLPMPSAPPTSSTGYYEENPPSYKETFMK